MHFINVRSMQRACLVASILAITLLGHAHAQEWGYLDKFSVSSTTFANGSTLPLSMIDEIPSNGINA